MGEISTFYVGIFPGRVKPVTNWLSRGYPGDIGAALGLLAWCQYSVTARDKKKKDPQIPSQCGRTYTSLSRSVPEINQHVAGTLSRSVPEINQHVAGTLSRSVPEINQHVAGTLSISVPEINQYVAGTLNNQQRKKERQTEHDVKHNTTVLPLAFGYH